MNRIVIPARGTVWFTVFNLDDDLPGEPALRIDGPTEWVRPVVGLVLGSWWGGSHDPLEPSKHEGFRWLDTTPLVADECGEIYGVHEYLESVVGEYLGDHAAHMYRPHIDGPVTEAPVVRRINKATIAPAVIVGAEVTP
jgi:hypothetical protein